MYKMHILFWLLTSKVAFSETSSECFSFHNLMFHPHVCNKAGFNVYTFYIFLGNQKVFSCTKFSQIPTSMVSVNASIETPTLEYFRNEPFKLSRVVKKTFKT